MCACLYLQLICLSACLPVCLSVFLFVVARTVSATGAVSICCRVAVVLPLQSWMPAANASLAHLVQHRSKPRVRHPARSPARPIYPPSRPTTQPSTHPLIPGAMRLPRAPVIAWGPCDFTGACGNRRLLRVPRWLGNSTDLQEMD